MAAFPEFRTAETPIASTVPEPHGKPGGGLWGHPGLLAPPYIEHVAGRLMEEGHDESSAYHIAVGVVQDWAAGHDGHGHPVHPDVQAAAAENAAEWEALKAKYGGGKRFNPYHLPPGPLGGEFTGPGGGGGGAKGGKGGSGKTAPARTPARKPPAHGQPAGKKHGPLTGQQHATKARLLAQARADRAKAHQLQAHLRALEAQLHASAAVSKKAAAAHKAAAAGKTVTGKVASKAGHKTLAKHSRATAKSTAALQLRVTALRVQIRDLLAQAARLEAQAHQIRSIPDVAPVAVPGASRHQVEEQRRSFDGCWG